MLLHVGGLYPLRVRSGEGPVLKVLRHVPGDYSSETYVVRSEITGWTMTVHHVTLYDDGAIDWDYSTNGVFTRIGSDGLLYAVKDYCGVTDDEL